MLTLICLVLTVARLVLVAALIVSWFPVPSGTALDHLRQILRGITDPVLGPVRHTVPPLQLRSGAVDLSPVIVLVVLTIVQVLIGC